MKKKLERMRDALNRLDAADLQLIEDSGVFYDSAIEQITKHLEWMVSRKTDTDTATDKLLFSYRFVGGGFNQTYAYNIQQAKLRVRREWKDSKWLNQVDWDSFKIELDHDAYYRAGSMMCD